MDAWQQNGLTGIASSRPAATFLIPREVNVVEDLRISNDLLLSNEHPVVVSSRPVLVVDRNSDSATVLKSALERRGVATLGACRARHGLELARQHHPRVIVLDIEDLGCECQAVFDDFAAIAEAENACLVVLGNCRRTKISLPACQRVTKPYHYAPLIRRIEQILESTDDRNRTAKAA